ncbi:MAG: hypothetical protein L0Y56_01370, partial [Nitrospira sp.]|nr:hypothetical protein [Nitrospira sp.]
GGKTEQVAGLPIITAGNIPLLTDIEHFPGNHDLQMRLRLDLSTLQNTPNWPILIWNLIHWRATQLPGLESSNLRLGTEAMVTVKPEIESVRVIDPAGKMYELPVHNKTVRIKAGMMGVHEIQINSGKDDLSDQHYFFASNALYLEESNLLACTSGRWGSWVDTASLQWEYQNIAWIFLLLVMGILTLHRALVARGL